VLEATVEGAETGSLVRLTHGLVAPRPLDLKTPLTSSSLHLLDHIFICEGDASRHDG
jgi:hypothetical protein